MAISIKNITLWRKDTMHNPGVLAGVLEPLAESGTNLRLVMGYGTEPERATIELAPISGSKATAAAQSAGFAAAETPCLLLEGDDRPGLGAEIARAIGDAGVNVSFLVAQTIGRKFTAVIGFADDALASAAADALRAVSRAKPSRASRAKSRPKSRASSQRGRARRSTKQPRAKAKARKSKRR